jgi:hypothetical protein
MQIHALGLEDLYEEVYALIGIHTILEDYRLAYLLNKNLQTCFAKSQKNLEFEGDMNKSSFSLYKFHNKKDAFDWFLIENNFKTSHQKTTDGFFLTTETKTYLIPEKKQVDFFIKISGEVSDDFIINTVNKIKDIEQVITSYSINNNSLKSRDFLIF